MTQPTSKLSLNAKVFYPTIFFLVVVIAYSLYNNEAFIAGAEAINQWTLKNFGWLFTWSAFLFLIILTVVYFSPLAKVRIGGNQAKPILSRWRWFATALCTTVATGILFWGTAEPLYHLYLPPSSLGLEPSSPEAAYFAMSTLFMHWSFTPYGIYTITGLVFALGYYNRARPFSISSLLFPFLKNKNSTNLGTVLDIICLTALVSGMAASLGTGILAIMGGLETTLGFTPSDALMGMIGLAIVATFIASAVSGLKKGITRLSNWNTRGFFVLAALLFFLGPTLAILKIGGAGLWDYGSHFLSRSTNIGANINSDWLKDWTIFYFANWYAWAPIAALFLGRLSVGYTVRDFIHFNLIFPSIFACTWMIIFGGASLAMDSETGGTLYQTLTSQGEGNVMYQIFESLPAGKLISIFALLVVFISYVTVADSNVSAMSAISSQGIRPETPEAPLWIKIVWGVLIGLIAWVMISSAGIDGIRLLCVLGGFPALFIIILAGLGMVKLLWERF
ncbi:MAG: BCCT family transporter [Bacteroidota bacterium]